MNPLHEIFDTYESWLAMRVLSLSSQHGSGNLNARRYEALNLSIAGLSKALASVLLEDHSASASAISLDDHFEIFSDFVRFEARVRRDRGTTLGEFLGLFKLYRRAYNDLLDKIEPARSRRISLREQLNACFDKAEVDFCEDWASCNDAPLSYEPRSSSGPNADDEGESTAAFEDGHIPAFILDSVRRGRPALLRLSRLIQLALDAIPQEIAILNEKGIIVLVNKAWAEGWVVRGSFSQKRAVGTDFLSLCDNMGKEVCENASDLGRAIRDMLAGRSETFSAEFPCHDSGIERWAFLTADCFRYGDSLRVLISFTDITSRKLAEIALRESEQKLDGILASVTDHIIMTDDDRTIIWANDMLKEAFGKDVEGRKCYSALLGRSTMCTSCAMEQCIKDGKAHDGEKTVIRPTGEVAHFWCTLNAATRYDDGRPKTFVEIFRDVTDRKRAHDLLLNSARLSAISDLATGVAHNFKNLLQVIMSAARLASMDLKQGDLEEAQASLAQIVRTSYFGAGAIKRLEDFAKPPGEHATESEEVFDLSATVGHAIDMSKPWWKSQPEKRGFRVRMERSLEKEALVKGHEGELFEVMVNLLRNAAEALRGDGKITVKVWVKPPNVLVSVHDTGMGISQENIQRVFDPFWTTKYDRGSGMGLARSRSIVGRHRGDMSVESESGAGSIFRIRLPLAVQDDGAIEADPDARESPKLNILVIDDQPRAAMLLRDGLARYGHHTMSSLSSEEGVALFERGSFDAVLCDLSMPGMNGLEVGERIKELCEERGTPKPFFVLITGWSGQDFENDEMIKKGIDAYVEKPAELEEIHQLVQRGVDEMRRRKPI